MIDQTKLCDNLIRYRRELRNAGDEVMAAVCLTLILHLRASGDDKSVRYGKDLLTKLEAA